MNRLFKKGISIIICVCVIFGVVPLGTFATENQSTDLFDTSNLEIEAGNALGNAIVDTMDSNGNSTDEYAISYVQLEGNMATVELVNVETCTLVVAIYNENGKMLGSGTTEVEPSIGTADVMIDIDAMPDYYIAKAFLLDENNGALCDEYICYLYTVEYQEFLSKTIYDFPNQEILKLDESIDNNFAVLLEETVSAEPNGYRNELLSLDDESGVYVFKNADETIKGLSQGDVFYFDDSDDNYVLIKVDTVETEGIETTVTAGDAEISDLFAYIKIDASAYADKENIDTSVMDEDIDYLGCDTYEEEQVSTYLLTRTSNNINAEEKSEFLFSLDKEWKDDDGTTAKINGELGLTLEAELKVSYDIKLWGKFYIDFYSKVSMDRSFNLKLEFESEETEEFGLPKFPIQVCPGVQLVSEPVFVVSGNISVGVSVSNSIAECGFSFDTKNGYRPIRSNEDDKWQPDLKGEFSAKIGVGLKVSAVVVKIISFEINGEAGFCIESTLTIPIHIDGEEKRHICSACYSVDISTYAKAGFKIKFSFGKILNWTPMDVTLAEITFPLFDCYWGNDFGFGECDCYAYLVTFKVVDEFSEPVAYAEIDCGANESIASYNNDKTVITANSEGVASYYYPEGIFNVTVNDDEIGEHIASVQVKNSAIEKEIRYGDFSDSLHTHTTGFWETVFSATCIQTGTEVEKCPTCNMIIDRRTVDKAEHSGGMFKTTLEPTCVKNGVMISRCTVCSKVVDKIVDPATGIHFGGDWIVTTEATCYEDGVKIKKCLDCDNVLATEAVPCTGHGTPIWEFTEDAETGELIGTSWCSRCGVVLENKSNILTFALVDDFLGLSFREQFEGYVVMDCDDTVAGEITIPSVFNNKPVEYINENAFEGCKNLTQVIIPEGIRGIGINAFLGCQGLTSIKFPDTLKWIDYGAFQSCSNLTDIDFGNGVEYIGIYAFWGLDFEYLFIPSNVKEIHHTAFWSCENLKSIVFNDGDTKIESYAFENCTNLTDISFGNGKVRIEENAFADCTSLTNIIISKGVTKIDEGAFANCINLEKLVVDSENQYYSFDEYDVLFNKDKTVLLQYPVGNRRTSYRVPDSVTRIADYAFAYCDNLFEIVIPNDSVEIGSNAFYSCDNLSVNYQTETYSVMRTTAYVAETNIVEPDGFVFVASAENSVIRNKYMLLVLSQTEGEIDLSNENLLYIGQQTATENEISFDFIPKSEDIGTVVIIGDFGQGTQTVIANEWKPEYKINWDNEGVITIQTVSRGAEIIPIADPEKTGYTFAGWTPQIPDVMPNYDLTFTAIWNVNNYDAVFNANGGTWADGSSKKNVSTEFGAEIIAPENPIKQGYVFSRWTPEVGVMDNINGKAYDAEWIPATDTRYTVETYTMNTSGEYEKTSQTFSGATGELAAAEYTVPTGFTLNAEKSVLEGTIAADNSLVLKVYIDRNIYTFTTVVDGVSTPTAYLYASMVSDPVTPSKTDYKFIKWNGTIPETMPAENVTITAVFEKYYVCPDCGNEILGEAEINEHKATESKMKATVKIKNNTGSNTIKYGETLRLTAITNNMPADAKIYWYVDGEKKGEGEIFNVSFENGTKTFEVKIVDSNGNVLKNASGNEIKDSESVTVKGGFFQKIISFFKNLFGMNRTVVQSVFKGVF